MRLILQNKKDFQVNKFSPCDKGLNIPAITVTHSKVYWHASVLSFVGRQLSVTHQYDCVGVCHK